jgi:hypothetical protein
MSVEIDWSSAAVRDGDVTIDLAGKAPKPLRERFEAVRALLGESSAGWDDVKLVKRTIHVHGLEPGTEPDLRHFLESIVVQVNAELSGDEADEADEADARHPGDRAAIADAEMTATLRAFAEPQAPR